MGIHSHKMILASAKAHADKCVNALATVKNPAAIPKMLEVCERQWETRSIGGMLESKTEVNEAYRAVMEDQPNE